MGRSYFKERQESNSNSTAIRSQVSTPLVSCEEHCREESTFNPELTFFLLPPLKLQHHIVMSHESVHRRVQVKDIPEEETVFPTELGDHHCHQSIIERLREKHPSS